MASQLAQGSSRSSSTPSSPGVCWRTVPYSAGTNVLPLQGSTRTNGMFPTETSLEAGSKVYGEYHIQLQLHRSLKMGCQYTHGFWGGSQGCSLYSFQKWYGFSCDHLQSGSWFLFYLEYLETLSGYPTWDMATNHTQALASPPAFGSELFYPSTDLALFSWSVKHKPGAANHEVSGGNSWSGRLLKASGTSELWSSSIRKLWDIHQEWLCSDPTLSNTLSPFISYGDCSIIQLFLQTCLTCTSQAEKTMLQQTIFFSSQKLEIYFNDVSVLPGKQYSCWQLHQCFEVIFSCFLNFFWTSFGIT